MAIEFTCPACSGTLRIRDGAVGRLVRCGGCMTTLRVPDAPPAFPGAEPAPAPPRPAARRPVAPATPTGPPPFDPQADEASAPRGRSFWVLVTLGSLAFGAFACCGLAAVVLPGPEWREFRSQRGGGYKVELPAAPRPSGEVVRRIRGLRNSRDAEGTVLWTRAENYVVIFADAAAGPGRTGDEILDAAVRDATLGERVRTEAVVVSGCPAREFEFRQHKGGTYTGRVVLAGDRVFLLLAGGRFTRPGNENVRRFLDSFEVTDPKLLEAAKNRELKAKQGKEPKPKVGD